MLELLKAKKPFTKENLEATYVQRRRASWVELEARVAEKSRDGFQRGVVTGMIGMALAGLSGGRLATPFPQRGRAGWGRAAGSARESASHPHPALSLKGEGSPGKPLRPWERIPSLEDYFRGHIPPGYADHVAFVFPNQCQRCGAKLRVEVCSGQAITPGENGVPNFDREKCVHCGACPVR
ncbi:MAG: hypothetical protein MUF81_10975 [Verrucomicrobia bacterium]|jgi:electron-transferring-flavoprotein dehydrogenase|nr:hypothetical protein [Verrucomicrobiota bacterium]